MGKRTRSWRSEKSAGEKKDEKEKAILAKGGTLSEARTDSEANCWTKVLQEPGAQPGHKYRPRRMLERTEEEVLLEDLSPDYAEGGAWCKTDEAVTKLFVGIRVEVLMTPYAAPVWVNDETEQNWRPPFPFGMEDEID